MALVPNFFRVMGGPSTHPPPTGVHSHLFGSSASPLGSIVSYEINAMSRRLSSRLEFSLCANRRLLSFAGLAALVEEEHWGIKLVHWDIRVVCDFESCTILYKLRFFPQSRWNHWWICAMKDFVDKNKEINKAAQAMPGDLCDSCRCDLKITGSVWSFLFLLTPVFFYLVSQPM